MDTTEEVVSSDRRITFFFPSTTPTERVHTFSKLKELIPGSTFVAMLEDFPGVSTMEVTSVSVEQWDACLLIADGQANLYSSDHDVFSCFHRFFGGSTFDLCWRRMLDERGAIFSELHKASQSRECGVVCLPEDIYRSVTAQFDARMVPFQAILVNSHLHTLCFDKGIPTDAIVKECAGGASSSITQLRMNGINRSLEMFQLTDQPLYGDTYMKKRGYQEGPMGLTGATGARGVTGATGVRGPCCTYQLTSPLEEGEVDNGECDCGSKPIKYNQRNHVLECRRDLSSSDEVKFIKALAQLLANKSKHEIRPSKRSVVFKPLYNAATYVAAHAYMAAVIAQPHHLAQPHHCKIQSVLHSELLHLEVFVGVVFVR